MDSSGFSTYRIMSFANIILLFSFQFECLVSFCFLIALAKASSILLSSTGEHGYSSFTLHQSFTTEYDFSCVFFVNALYHVKEVLS